MNIKQIEKYGEVIKWFIDNPEKGVWERVENDIWSLVKNPSFSKEDGFYVQNDEFAEIRRAIVDGRVIEVNVSNDEEKPKWEKRIFDISESVKPYDISEVKKYRVVYDSLINKGDWIVVNGKELHMVEEVFGDSYRCEDGYDYRDGVKPWIPQKGEWCVFYDKNDYKEFKRYIVAEYDSSFYSDGSQKILHTYLGCEDGNDLFDSIAPCKLFEILNKK